MERLKCKVCLKSFSNGRALSGHMRSHMLNLMVHPKHPEDDDRDHDQSHNHNPTLQFSELVSSSDEEADGDDDDKGFYHGLRENLKQGVRLEDPELCFAIDAASVVLQDRESETESSKNPTRRRSKRARKLLERHQYYPQEEQVKDKSIAKKLKFSKLSNYKKPKSWVEPEPVSSISDTTTEEDVAFCLMMLSRDKWKRKEKQDHHQEREQDYKEQEDEASMDETEESEEFKSCKTRIRGKYRCETCNKVFKSYQALGGHRASHKKLKLLNPIEEPRLQTGKFNSINNVVSSSSAAVKKIHECPYCYRVFLSGQALGGHKRSHGVSGIAEAAKTTTKKIENLNLLDLNLPAPVEEDDVSQVELSAVSDAEFVNHVKR